MPYTDNKIVIIGNSGVGKSTLMLWLLNNKFVEKIEPTIAASFCVKDVIARGERIKLNIWDTAGQERFRSIIELYYRNTIGCLCVFDVTNRESFDNLDYWLSEYERTSDHPHAIIIVANKCDKPESSWLITKKEIDRFIIDHQYELFYTNCITGKNAAKTFQRLAELIVDIRKDLVLIENPYVIDNNNTNTNINSYMGIIDLQAESWFKSNNSGNSNNSDNTGINCFC